MRTVRRMWRVGLVLAIMIALPACIKTKFLLIVYPDSSGKIEVSTGISKSLAEPGKMGGEEGESTTPSSEDIMEGSEGITWVTAEGYTEGDFTFSKVIGYFEDINKVKLKKATISFNKLEDGSYELSFIDKSAADEMDKEDNPFEGQDEESKAAVRNMMKMMMQGLELSYAFKLPGEVTAAEGMELEGREARLTIDIDKFIDMMEKPEEAKKGIEGKILAMPEGDLTEELAAFKKEMAEGIAKAAEEEAKKEAEKEGEEEAGEETEEEAGEEVEEEAEEEGEEEEEAEEEGEEEEEAEEEGGEEE